MHDDGAVRCGNDDADAVFEGTFGDDWIALNQDKVTCNVPNYKLPCNFGQVLVKAPQTAGSEISHTGERSRFDALRHRFEAVRSRALSWVPMPCSL